jgi:AcrR family transcriptional regulator
MPSASGVRRPGALSPRRGGIEVSEVQRARMLSSAVAVVSEYGYGQMSVARVTGRARVSRRTFYDVFEDREDCFLAVFDDAVARVSGLVVDAYGGAGGGWRERVRGALLALLSFLDGEPEVGSLLVVDALRAGPRVLARRAEVLRGVGVALDGGAPARGKSSRALGDLTGEGVVGAVFSVIHTRLLAREGRGSLVDLLGPLMAMIVLPYMGSAAAERERSGARRGARTVWVGRKSSSDRSKDRMGSSIGQQRPARLADSVLGGDPLVDLPMRLTYRTLRVLSVIGERSGASNREVADLAGVADQGQMSKLLARLERLGLVHNAAVGHGHRGGRRQPTGEPNVWRLTVLGEDVCRSLVVNGLGSFEEGSV